MNRWVLEAGALLLIGAVAASWHYRASIMARINPPASASNPMEQPDVLYTWVDKDGVRHYAQTAAKAAKAEKVEYDGSAITPMAPVEAPVIASEMSGDDGRQGSPLIHAMRDDIQRNRDKMERAKMAAAGLE